MVTFEDFFKLSKEEVDGVLNSFTPGEMRGLLYNAWLFMDSFVDLKTSMMCEGLVLPGFLRKALKINSIGGEQVYARLCTALRVNALYGRVTNERFSEYYVEEGDKKV